MIDTILLEAEEAMDDAVRATKADFANIRTGRANPGMFNQILVNYYGAPTPLQQLANIQIPEARMVLITPFDQNSTNEIVQAIRESDLGVNPSDDGNVIRVTLPQLTEERRKDYVRQARQRAEEGRISIRQARHKGRTEIETLKKDGDVGEDQADRGEKALDATTRQHTDQVDEILEAKEEDLLTV